MICYWNLIDLTDTVTWKRPVRSKCEVYLSCSCSCVFPVQDTLSCAVDSASIASRRGEASSDWLQVSLSAHINTEVTEGGSDAGPHAETQRLFLDQQINNLTALSQKDNVKSSVMRLTCWPLGRWTGDVFTDLTVAVVQIYVSPYTCLSFQQRLLGEDTKCLFISCL